MLYLCGNYTHITLDIMKTVFVFLAEGFEEIEAITTIDLLRRAGLAVQTIAVGDSLEVAGTHHIPVVADRHITNAEPETADAFVLPGGLPGVTNLGNSQALLEILRKAHNQGKLLAAICAAPSIFGSLGMLEGREATCYPSFEPQLGGYIPSQQAVVTTPGIITAKAAGYTADFAFAIITTLLGVEVSESVRKAIHGIN